MMSLQLWHSQLATWKKPTSWVLPIPGVFFNAVGAEPAASLELPLLWPYHARLEGFHSTVGVNHVMPRKAPEPAPAAFLGAVGAPAPTKEAFALAVLYQGRLQEQVLPSPRAFLGSVGVHCAMEVSGWHRICSQEPSWMWLRLYRSGAGLQWWTRVM